MTVSWSLSPPIESLRLVRRWMRHSSFQALTDLVLMRYQNLQASPTTPQVSGRCLLLRGSPFVPFPSTPRLKAKRTSSSTKSQSGQHYLSADIPFCALNCTTFAKAIHFTMRISICSLRQLKVPESTPSLKVQYSKTHAQTKDFFFSTSMRY